MMSVGRRPSSYSGFEEPVRIGCAGWNIPALAAAEFSSAGTQLERYSQCLIVAKSILRFTGRTKLGRGGPKRPNGLPFFG